MHKSIIKAVKIGKKTACDLPNPSKFFTTKVSYYTVCVKPFKFITYVNKLIHNFKQDGGYILSLAIVHANMSMNLHWKQKAIAFIHSLIQAVIFGVIIR